MYSPACCVLCFHVWSCATNNDRLNTGKCYKSDMKCVSATVRGRSNGALPSCGQRQKKCSNATTRIYSFSRWRSFWTDDAMWDVEQSQQWKIEEKEGEFLKRRQRKQNYREGTGKDHNGKVQTPQAVWEASRRATSERDKKQSRRRVKMERKMVMEWVSNGELGFP